jgi:hypothetical protein
MNPQDLTWLIEKLAKYGVVGFVSGGIVFMLCRNFMGSYLNKKGENLATKEDIVQLTTLVKGVEHGYNVLIEDMKGKQQLRMAAVDKRLLAHQEAFTHWYELVVREYANQGSALAEAQNWWNRNCLDLEPEVRIAFIDTCNQVHHRGELKRRGAPDLEITQAYARIRTFPDVLFKAIKLPGLTAEEQKAVQPIAEPKHARTTA